MFDLTQAERDVLTERRGHLTREGWTAEHDDVHELGEMALAAAAYAAYAAGSIDGTGKLMSLALRLWPWAMHWWKPKGAREDLVRAASLILAEIDRIDRRAA